MLLSQAYISAASSSDTFSSVNFGILGESGFRKYLTKEPKLISVADIWAARPLLPLSPWQAEQLCIANHRFPSSTFPSGAVQAVSNIEAEVKKKMSPVVLIFFTTVQFPLYEVCAEKLIRHEWPSLKAEYEV